LRRSNAITDALTDRFTPDRADLRRLAAKRSPSSGIAPRLVVRGQHHASPITCEKSCTCPTAFVRSVIHIKSGATARLEFAALRHYLVTD
jgi:hypothetical protein